MKKRISKVILATALLFGSVATNIKASEKVDFVAMGDSITTGYGLPGYREPDAMVKPPVLAYAEGSFVEQLKENYSFNTTNFGADGVTSEELLVGFQWMSDTQKDIIRGADVISLNIGGNDLLSILMEDIANALNKSDPTLKIDPTDSTAIIKALSTLTVEQALVVGTVLNDIKNKLPGMVQTFSTNLNTIIGNIKGLNKNAQIIVQTIANPYKDLYTHEVLGTMALAIDEGVQAFNKIINQGASPVTYRVADVYTVFDNPDYTELTNAANPAKFLDPHPTFAGHTLIAFTLLDAMDKKLTKVENVIEPIVDLENGAPKTVEGLKLPELGVIEFAIKQAPQTGKATVDAVNEMGIKNGAEIIWDLNNCKYDPALKTAQKFTVNGTIVLPENTSNENKLPLEVSIEVNVKAGKVEPSVPEKKPEAVDEVKKTPDTSDTTSLIALSISALVACGAMLVLKYRKNSKAIK